MRRTVLAGLAGLLALHAAPARAHTVGVSRGEYRVSGSTLEAELVFARPELAAAVPGLDADRDGSVSAAEVAESGRLLEDAIVRHLEVHVPSGPCEGRLENAALTEQDGLAVRATYHCAGEARPLSIRLGFLGALSLGHRHIASATARAVSPSRTVAEAMCRWPKESAPRNPRRIESGLASPAQW